MILLTGATGFVGGALVEALLSHDYHVSALVREITGVLPVEVGQFVLDLQDLGLDVSQPLVNIDEELNALLATVDVLVHCAARVHMMQDSCDNPLAEFRKMNRDSTLSLARKAADAGVERFVFMSSVKVNGEITSLNLSQQSSVEDGSSIFSPDDDLVPTDPYGLSKYEAEQGLLALAKETGMEIVIIRSPLVYGPNVKANFLSMIKWANKSIPLPLGAIHNQRSLVALDNLVSFIIHCIDHPKAANEVFLISDGEDVSTTELLQKVAKAFGKRSLLIPVPVWLMAFAAKLIGKGDVARRLFGSLQVDSSKARDLLGWKPVVTMDEQLKKIADEYLHEKNH